MTGNLFEVQDDGAQPWPFIITVNGKPEARVTDHYLAESVVRRAEVSARDEMTKPKLTPVESLLHVFRDHMVLVVTEGSPDSPGWVTWPEWLECQKRAEAGEA